MRGSVYIGVDPGQSGGIAAVGLDGHVVKCARMPDTEREILDVLSSCFSTPVDARAVLERVGATPQMGVVSSFKFGCGYGGLRMALTVIGVPFDEVHPSRWQRALGCMTRGDKNISKARAQDLFPRERVTHAVADALLLAEYCRRLALGSVQLLAPKSVKKSRPAAQALTTGLF